MPGWLEGYRLVLPHCEYLMLKEIVECRTGPKDKTNTRVQNTQGNNVPNPSHPPFAASFCSIQPVELWLRCPVRKDVAGVLQSKPLKNYARLIASREQASSQAWADTEHKAPYAQCHASHVVPVLNASIEESCLS